MDIRSAVVNRMDRTFALTRANATFVVIAATIASSLCMHLVSLARRRQNASLHSSSRRRNSSAASKSARRIGTTSKSDLYDDSRPRRAAHATRASPHASASARTVASTLQCGVGSPLVDSTRPVLVLFSTPASAYDWNALLWHCIHTSTRPSSIHFGIIVHCSKTSDADVDVDSLLRSRVRLYHSIASSTERVTPALLSRLVRKFVMGDEAFVVVIDKRVRLRPSWDSTIRSICLSPHDILTAPASCGEDTSFFPCVRALVASTECTRAPSLPFHMRVPEVVPSVCWCAELTCALPHTLKFVCDRASCSHTFVVTPLPLVYDDTQLERAYHNTCAYTSTSCFALCRTTSSDDARHPTPSSVPTPRVGSAGGGANIRNYEPSAVVAKCERVGLSEGHDDRESILKFGSTRAAKLAIKFRNE